MRLRLRCGNSYRLGDLQWCMVHVPENVFTVRDFAGHVSRLLELNLHGGNAELPQILLDGFMVPHDEEVREVLRDDEVVDVEVLDSAGVEPSQGSHKRHQADLPGHGGNKRLKGSPAPAPVMALGWQPDPEKSDADKAVEAAKALALATCTDGAPSNGCGKDEGRGIFVGGLPTSVDDKELRKHFEQFGTVQDATVVMNQKTGKPKGFGFVEFREPGAREKVLSPVVTLLDAAEAAAIPEPQECNHFRVCSTFRLEEMSPDMVDSEIKVPAECSSSLLAHARYVILKFSNEEQARLNDLYHYSRKFFSNPSAYKEGFKCFPIPGGYMTPFPGTYEIFELRRGLPGCPAELRQAMEAFAVLEKLALDFATQASVRHFEASPSEGDDFTHTLRFRWLRPSEIGRQSSPLPAQSRSEK
ncbi:unnamed protein product [Symbiodinium necroappetens]|uniref:RRM domain-containing protein n=1 Tax=Symbiodinium necroappetens TaxID=1628268 RepID=A0A812WR24_9DINO|nr:unnamed protein product [Symbiodinium necroappetens]